MILNAYRWNRYSSISASSSFRSKSTIGEDTSQINNTSASASRGISASSKVEYLHRTVKDFMERSDIWDFITGSGDPNFDPHLGLCRSFWIQLRTLPAKNSSKLFWETLSWSFEYAVRIADNNIQLYTELIHDIDHAAVDFSTKKSLNEPSYIETLSGDCRPDRHWASVASSGSPEDGLLEFAVRCQLVDFLQIELQQRHMSRLRKTQLLNTAVSSFSIPFDLPGRLVCVRKSPNRQW